MRRFIWHRTSCCSKQARWWRICLWENLSGRKFPRYKATCAQCIVEFHRKVDDWFLSSERQPNSGVDLRASLADRVGDAPGCGDRGADGDLACPPSTMG